MLRIGGTEWSKWLADESQPVWIEKLTERRQTVPLWHVLVARANMRIYFESKLLKNGGREEEKREEKD